MQNLQGCGVMMLKGKICGKNVQTSMTWASLENVTTNITIK
jgi:hypothetical protein